MAHDVTRGIVRACWASIGLGLLFEGMQLAVVGLGGETLPALAAIVADTAQKVSWSSLICVSLAAGTAAARASPGAVATVGFLGAPFAFGVARALHKTVGQVLSVTVPAGGPSPWLLAGIKAVEYAIFGWLVARLMRRPDLGLAAYVRVGLVVGVVFGSVLLWIMNSATPSGLPALTLLARALNELLFPVGCAAVLWVSGVLARRGVAVSE